MKAHRQSSPGFLEAPMSLLGRMGRGLGLIVGVWIICGGLIALILWRNENAFGPALFLFGIGVIATISAISRIFSGHSRESTAHSQRVVGDPIPMFWYLGCVDDEGRATASEAVWCAAIVTPPLVRVHAAHRDLGSGNSDDPWADLGN